MKTDIIVDVTGPGVGSWDMFEQNLSGIYAIGFKQSVLDWFNERFNVIKFTATKKSMNTPIKEILSCGKDRPRYSIEELKKLSEYFINEGQIVGQAIKGIHDLVYLLNNNPKLVKKILECE